MPRASRTAAALVLATALSLGVPGAEAQMPAAAKELFDRGNIAAAQQSWDLAIDYFYRADRTMPDRWRNPHPDILMNLGLAYGQAGDEIPAIIVLELYLAAARRAANASQIRSAITQLETQAIAKADKILGGIATMVIGSPGASWQPLDTIAIVKSDACGVLAAVAEAQAWIGRTFEAQTTAGAANCRHSGRFTQPFPRVDKNAGDAVNSGDFDQLARAYWRGAFDDLGSGRTRSENRETWRNTGRALAEARNAAPEMAPYRLYGVAGTIAYWVAQIRVDRASMETYRRGRR